MLNLAAALLESGRLDSDHSETGHRALRILLTALFVVGLLAMPASALEGIDLSSPAEATAEGECPRLIQIKYPFLDCASGQIGQSAADENWDNSRRIPIMSGWTEGDGAWGPDLNTN